MIPRTHYLFLPLVFGGCESTPMRSDLEGKPISQLVIHDRGGKLVEEARLRSFIRSQPGSDYSRERTNEDIATLYQSGLVTDVRFVPKASGPSVRLIAEVETRPPMGPGGFIGNTVFSDQRLAKESKLPMKPPTAAAVQEACLRIEKLYHSNGYPKATVRPSSQWNGATRQGIVQFVVVENPDG